MKTIDENIDGAIDTKCNINIVKGDDVYGYKLISKEKKTFEKFVNGESMGIVSGKDLQGIVSRASFYASLIYTDHVSWYK